MEIPFLAFGDYPMELDGFADNPHLNSSGSITFSRFFNENVSRNQMLIEGYVNRLIEVQHEESRAKK